MVNPVTASSTFKFVIDLSLSQHLHFQMKYQVLQRSHVVT